MFFIVADKFCSAVETVACCRLSKQNGFTVCAPLLKSPLTVAAVLLLAKYVQCVHGLFSSLG